MSTVARLCALLACAAAARPAIAAAEPFLDQRQPLVVPATQKLPLLVGGAGHQKLAQVVTAGRDGTLVAVAAPVTCGDGASLALEIRGVHEDAYGRTVPDATVRATGTMPAALLPAFADPGAPDLRMLPLSSSVPLASGEAFAFVLSASGDCALAQAPAGELYASGDASFIDDLHASFYEWLWLGLSRRDLAFETWMEPPVRPIAIDVRPGSDENPVNLGARGSIPVAILGSAALDVATVDVASVRFAGAAPDAGGGGVRTAAEDVNGDGRADLVLHFRIAELALSASDVEATLTARTLAPDGAELTGSDRIRVVPAKAGDPR